MIIYLAAPYSHKDPKICKERFNLVNKKAGEIMKQGHVVFSPISHSHPIAMATDLDALDSTFWTDQDLAFMPVCDEMWIYRIPGWKESKGIKREGKEAKLLNIPVRFI